MVGPASLLALWILSATAPGVAISTDREDGAVVSVAFRERPFRTSRAKRSRRPLPPQRLPPDPAYDAKQPTPSNKEGHSRPAAVASADAGREQAEHPGVPPPAEKNAGREQAEHPQLPPPPQEIVTPPRSLPKPRGRRRDDLHRRRPVRSVRRRVRPLLPSKARGAVGSTACA